ncbi:MAG: hypothetical protein A2293_02130 [Elusimicrobia bacterium RIFOXYB2_FULL_49_7]|nr:MAG: hypothetical protein A2293_02130 [Elusimicrobia bacterium RIFOXYB2_FULL_49_7]
MKENWSSRIGVVLAVAGSAVGLGNFIRFPGLAVSNGGGAFLIPYFISFFILGIPLCWIESNPALPEQNVNNALGFMWNPKFDVLAQGKVWLAAAGQIFFTLSIGFGLILTYASYVRRNEDVVLSGLTASATNEFAEVVLGGLITIPDIIVTIIGLFLLTAFIFILIHLAGRNWSRKTLYLKRSHP